MNKTLSDIIEWIMMITVALGVVFGMFYFWNDGYDTGREDLFLSCDEVCFHKAEPFGQDTIGYLFNGSCICADWNVYGWG